MQTALANRAVARAAVARPATGRLVAARPAPKLVCQASKKPLKVDTAEIEAQWSEFASSTTELLATKWEQVEDKPAALAVTGGALLALTALSAVVGTIDKIPVVSDLVELVGVFVTGFFAWRYLTVPADREELVATAKGYYKKIIG